VHDTLRGFNSEPRRVSVWFYLEQAVDHRPHSLAIGAGIECTLCVKSRIRIADPHGQQMGLMTQSAAPD